MEEYENVPQGTSRYARSRCPHRIPRVHNKIKPGPIFVVVTDTINESLVVIVADLLFTITLEVDELSVAVINGVDAVAFLYTLNTAVFAPVRAG